MEPHSGRVTSLLSELKPQNDLVANLVSGFMRHLKILICGLETSLLVKY